LIDLLQSGPVFKILRHVNTNDIEHASEIEFSNWKSLTIGD